MRELTISEMEQVSGGAFAHAATAGCIAGAVSSNDPLGGIMNCAGGAATGLAFSLAIMSGPIGFVAWTAVGVGVAYVNHQANEYLDDQRPNGTPAGSS